MHNSQKRCLLVDDMKKAASPYPGEAAHGGQPLQIQPPTHRLAQTPPEVEAPPRRRGDGVAEKDRGQDGLQPQPPLGTPPLRLWDELLPDPLIEHDGTIYVELGTVLASIDGAVARAVGELTGDALVLGAFRRQVASERQRLGLETT